MQMEGVAIYRCSPLQLSVTHITEDRQLYWCACCDKSSPRRGVSKPLAAIMTLLAHLSVAIDIIIIISARSGSSRGIPPVDGYPTKMAYRRLEGSS